MEIIDYSSDKSFINSVTEALTKSRAVMVRQKGATVYKTLVRNGVYLSVANDPVYSNTCYVYVRRYEKKYRKSLHRG